MSDNVSFKDYNSASKTFRTTENAGIHTPHHNIDTFPAQHIDAFSRGRTSDPGYRFDSQFTYGIDADLWDQKKTGDASITHSEANRDAYLLAGLTAGTNTAILQSHYHAPYTPGRGQLAFITGSFGASVDGEVGMGYYDGTNGVYLKSAEDVLYVGIASSTEMPDVEVAQDDWNIDPLDGSGPSGITLDMSKTNIFVIQLQALYVGRVVVGFDIGGNLVPVHEFNHANAQSFPYISQASLPVRYWASNTDAYNNVDMTAVCSTVISEGGADLQDINGRQFAAHGTIDNAPNNTAVLIVQPKEQLNSIDSNTILIPTDVDVTVEGAGCWIEIRRNVTISNSPTATDADANLSAAQFYAAQVATAPTVTDGTGQLIDKFYLPASATIRSSSSKGLGGKAVLCFSHLLSTADNIAIIADGGSTSEVRASLKWKEIR